MAYLGVQPLKGQNRTIDNISASFNGSNVTFNLTSGGFSLTPATAYQLFISVGGVLQSPGVDFTVSGNQITFTTAPAAGLSFWGLYQGDAIDSVSVSDGSITTAKLATGLTVTLGAGAVGTPSLTFAGDTNTGIYSPAADTIAFVEGGVEALRITSTGQVAVSTSGSAAAPVITKSDDLNTGIFFPAADTIAFAEGGTEVVRIDSSGRVGIGTTSPSQLLHVNNGNILLSTGYNTYFGSTSNLIGGDSGLGRIDIAAGGGSANTIVISTAGSERARIDSSGRLLVGTSTGSSTARLMVEGNTSDGLAGVIDLQYGGTSPADGTNIGGVRFKDRTSDTFYAAIQCNADGATGAADKNGRLVFSTTADGASSPTERMRITNSGFVYIANTGGGSGANAGYGGETFVVGGGGVNNALFYTTGAINAGTAIEGARQNDGQVATWFRNGSAVGNISVTSSATAYNTSSDYRLKENVIAVTDGIARLQQLKPSRFNFIADPDKTVDGFIAHEVQTVVPEAITGEKDAVDADGNPVYQGIDQSKLVPLLTAALQEAVAEINALKDRVAALEGA